MTNFDYPVPIEIAYASESKIIEELRKLTTILDLNHVLDYVEATNKNVDCYHSTNHMICVAYIAYYIWYKSKDLYCSDFEIRRLLTAALFHDYGHSLGKVTDTQNVKNAIESYLDFESNNLTNILDRDTIVNLIRCTEFPFIVEPKTKLEKILRDADLIYGMLSSDICIRLADEMGMDYETMQTQRIEFYKNVEFFTGHGVLLRDKMFANSVVALQKHVEKLMC